MCNEEIKKKKIEREKNGENNRGKNKERSGLTRTLKKPL